MMHTDWKSYQLATPTFVRYMEEGCDGTLKDTLLELAWRHDCLCKSEQRILYLVNSDKMDADTAYERMCRLAERINDLRERVFALIPQSYFPRVCVLN